MFVICENYLIEKKKMYSQIIHHLHQNLFTGSYYHGQTALFSYVNLLLNFEMMLKRKQIF